MEQEKPQLWRYGLRHVLGLFLSTVLLVIYLFLVTIADGWGSRFGNGFGGGVALLVWAIVPTVAVGRLFARREARMMGWGEALRIAFPASVLLSVFIIWTGLGMRSDRPELRLSDGQFWLLHVGYIVVAFGFFTGALWLRARLEARRLRGEA
ncbi:hypothetical protein KUL25_18650 [Rhodobacteraceae bacterium N5(2021)]|uniref:Transmembrane protein n=1 Tax=Gymnodinialimonas phycosphaerae TaxID=2841589 RepID=A0A975YFJ7_9RHOB|nr:hypothetical protein [Gymnodinialimonas phycosphaerae]MBY4894781.1 hypothetical protein [Gymnodinialimonas phycosphaerae]